MTNETKKILDDKIDLTATCVRLPISVSHSESVNIQFEKSFFIKASAIWTAFKAAPFSKLSETIHKFIVLGWESSILILEIKVSNLSSASTGVMYPPSLCSSITLQPGEVDKTFLISSKLHFLSNSTFTLIEWETRTGILTHVDVTLIFYLIFFLFHL